MTRHRNLTIRLLIVFALSSLALSSLFDAQGQWQLEIDASPSSLGAEVGPNDVVTGMISGPMSGQLMQSLEELTRRLKKESGVSSVRSIATVELPFTLDGEVEIHSLAQRLRQQPEKATEWMAVAFSDPLVRGRLISSDEKKTLIRIETRSNSYEEGLLVTQRISALIDEHFKTLPEHEIALTGRLIISDAMSQTLMTELGVIVPLAILLFAILLWCAFQTLMVVIAALGTVLFAMLWTLGLAAGLGWSLNLVTIVIPPLVLALSVACVMHVVSAYADEGNLESGIRRIAIPLAATAVTTAIGLAALAVNSLESIRQFAILGAVGAVNAAVASVTALPLLLTPMPSAPRLWPSVHSKLVFSAGWIANYVIVRSKRTIYVAVVFLAAMLICATQIQPGAHYVRDLPAEHPVRANYDDISRHFGGANGFSIHIESSGTDAILIREVLVAIDQFQRWLEAQPEIGATRSLPDFVKRVNQAITDGSEAMYRIPDNARSTKQLLVIGGPREVYDYTNLNFSRVRIQVQTDVTDSGALRNLFDRITEQAEERLPAGLRPTLKGNAVTLTETIEELTGGQMQSLSIAAVAIFLVLSILFASPLAGLMALLPNILPVSAFFGLLGLTGIPLGPTTALVACIVLGIAVDDTMHLLVRFNEVARQKADEKQAARQAVEEVIRPITLTTIAIACGFLTLSISEFSSQVAFGSLAAVTLAIAWVSDLFLAPAIAARTSIVNMWDVLRLDLGQEPEKAIPLFADMTRRQARLVALGGEMRHIPPEEDLIRQGDEGTEMFIVVEGKFRVWIPRRDGGETEINQIARGSVLGESGLFFQKRTASVTALAPSRVLVFNNASLERLRRRYPRAGALTYRNLNRIQAERMAGNTQRFLNETEKLKEV